jgi:hypothetical protein
VLVHEAEEARASDVKSRVGASKLQLFTSSQQSPSYLFPTLISTMADTATDTRPQVPTKAKSQNTSALKTSYLVLYNLVSAILWFTVLGRVVSVGSLTRSTSAVYNATFSFTRGTQSLALLEIVHSILGSLIVDGLPAFNLLTHGHGRNRTSAGLDNSHASRKSDPSYLRHCGPIPLHRAGKSCLFDNAASMEHHRSRSLYILCIFPDWTSARSATMA